VLAARPTRGTCSDERRLQGTVLAVCAAEAVAEPSRVVTRATSRAIPEFGVSGVGIDESISVRAALGVSTRGTLALGAVGATVSKLALAAVHLGRIPRLGICESYCSRHPILRLLLVVHVKLLEALASAMPTTAARARSPVACPACKIAIGRNAIKQTMIRTVIALQKSRPTSLRCKISTRGERTKSIRPQHGALSSCSPVYPEKHWHSPEERSQLPALEHSAMA